MKLLKPLFVLLVCILTSTLLSAGSPQGNQLSESSKQKNEYPTSTQKGSPLGAGISMLVTLGLAFGIRRFMDRQIPVDDIT
ncbi:MAG: hypothetical protein IPH45_07795 [Bacteroidales bacterium]|nr:hypothetical protein [Bacteroidales bacterium]